MITEKNCSLRKTASHQTDIMLLFKEQIRKNTATNVNCFFGSKCPLNSWVQQTTYPSGRAAEKLKIIIRYNKSCPVFSFYCSIANEIKPFVWNLWTQLSELHLFRLYLLNDIRFFTTFLKHAWKRFDSTINLPELSKFPFLAISLNNFLSFPVVSVYPTESFNI